MLQGNVHVNGSAAREAQLVLLDQNGEGLFIEADDEALVLLLRGEPINEPIVGHGPFVMNTQKEIAEAFADFNNGKFGDIAH